MTSDAHSGADEPGDPPEPTAAPDTEIPRIVELQEEIGQLKEAVTSHAVVDQAIGMMVALGRVTPDQGWAVLRDVSQHTNIKLRNVAELIIIWGQKGDLPPDIRATLEDALDRYGPTLIPDVDSG
ncbi:ANTAR domain-containing protein [Streptomyces sp. 2A115]|uniref:ANTAR domain-containing protein n=1 Tax=Streptomyces sp. 2A115 TaxID=3457439 RepID=UPI003FD3DC6E